MRIDGSVAIVSGGASGLGRAAASTLAEAGAHVILLDLPTSPGERTAAELGPHATFVAGDVTDPDAVAAAVSRAGELGPLRIVVTCAGVADAGRVVGRKGPLPLEGFEKVIRVNLIGTFNVIRLAAAAIAELPPEDDERGVIVTTASVAAFDGQVGQAAYSASKGGVAAMTLPIARELAGSRIRVATIAPGLFDTPMMAGLPEAARTSLAAQVPHPSRLGRPSEYGALVRHLIENPMLNGEVIRLDGAIRMAAK